MTEYLDKLTNQVNETIKNIKEYSDEDLVHILKVAWSKKSAKEKTIVKKLITAIEKERKQRGTTTIDSKGVPIKGKK